MRVLRSNKDSVMAMLEAFVHDPLINWRLLNTTTDAVDAGNTPTGESSELPGHLLSTVLKRLARSCSLCTPLGYEGLLVPR